MGSSQEKHRHEEAIKEIDNEKELKMYIEKNHLQEHIAEIERLKKCDLYKHEENMEQKRIDYDDMLNKNANEKLRIERDSENRAKELTYNHEERKQELNNESKKIDNQHTKEMQEITFKNQEETI